MDEESRSLIKQIAAALTAISHHIDALRAERVAHSYALLALAEVSKKPKRLSNVYRKLTESAITRTLNSTASETYFALLKDAIERVRKDFRRVAKNPDEPFVIEEQLADGKQELLELVARAKAAAASPMNARRKRKDPAALSRKKRKPRK